MATEKTMAPTRPSAVKYTPIEITIGSAIVKNVESVSESGGLLTVYASGINCLKNLVLGAGYRIEIKKPYYYFDNAVLIRRTVDETLDAISLLRTVEVVFRIDDDEPGA